MKGAKAQRQGTKSAKARYEGHKGKEHEGSGTKAKNKEHEGRVQRVQKQGPKDAKVAFVPSFFFFFCPAFVLYLCAHLL